MEPFVLAITGASAQPLAENAVKYLLSRNYKVHLILSKGAYEVWKSEMNISVPVNQEKQEHFWRKRLEINTGILTCHRWNDNSANIASGSFITKGMLIIPCTMGTIGRISSGISTNLIERCADVHLKERRKLVIVPRETPLSLIHLRNLVNLSEAGANIVPPIPAWYTQPNSIQDMVDFILMRIFDSLGVETKAFERWDGPIK